MEGCSAKAPPLLVQGVTEFNSGLYFECHETLEELWLQEKALIRELYQGILQVGVSLYKQKQGNYRGAVNLMRRALVHLAPCDPTCQGIDVAQLLEDAQRILTALMELGPESVSDMDQSLVPQIRWTSGSDSQEQVSL